MQIFLNPVLLHHINRSLLEGGKSIFLQIFETVIYFCKSLKNKYKYKKVLARSSCMGGVGQYGLGCKEEGLGWKGSIIVELDTSALRIFTYILLN